MRTAYHIVSRLLASSWAMTLRGRGTTPEGVREAETAKGLKVLIGHEALVDEPDDDGEGGGEPDGLMVTVYHPELRYQAGHAFIIGSLHVPQDQLDKSEGRKWSSGDTNVDDDYQRQGVATLMYDYAEEVLGRGSSPSGIRSGPGKDFWEAGEHPRGERGAAKVAYGPEQGMLHRYLREGFDPYDYSYELEGWLEEHACEECGAGDDPDCEKCGGKLRAEVEEVTGGDDALAWIDRASDADIARFREHVEGKVQGGDMGPDRPAYEHMSFSRLVRPTWLVHFTDDPYGIASEGFTHGWDSTEGLGLTTQFADEARHRGPGYNFAFTLGSRDARNALNSRGGPKYGKHAVVFWAGGVEAYHYGDEENQVIFWGPEVPPSRIFALWNGEDDGWCVRDAVDRVVFGVDDGAPYDERAKTKDFEEAAEWAAANHRMLAGTQEGVERVERERKRSPRAAGRWHAARGLFPC